MDLTRDKFQEAEFFLGQMREHVDEDSFRYHMSAFVSGARAVTNVFQKEYRRSQHEEIFQEWYGGMSGGNGSDPPEPGTIQDYMRNEPIFVFMNSLRNTVLKEGLPLTTATMLTETDISPTAIELLVDEDFPAPQVILETKDGVVIGSSVGYAWKIVEEENQTLLLAIDQDGNWSAIMGFNNLEYDQSELRCRYNFRYGVDDVDDLNALFFAGEGEDPESLRRADESSTDVNTVITRLCERYLQEINSILGEWERYLADETGPDELTGL